MALSEEHQRRLAAIEDELTSTDPRFARRFARFHGTAIVARVAAVAATIMGFAAAVTLLVIGIEIRAVGAIALGAIATALAPVVIGWRWWRRSPGRR